ncbi:DUF4435 domain-containing protein [Aeromonas dhakensis]|uniref:DUF4435 domain-containing protein n=1 Tax=Aeromonas dhakensis TaxID=196024 RepID=UPI0024412E81|nr:DUF4435 domain-containing protein [Aeromonas dhakensis]HEA3084931.1 DUF4435 domain-containing protein [Aeromonas dhakensis]
MLERSLVGKFAKSVFFEDENDIDIYIEDTAVGYDKILGKVFLRVFNGRFKVGRVYPLGSRKEVIKHHSENIHSISRPTLYVVDGDLFMLCGDYIENKIGLYKLPVYCIENILCCHNAFHRILDEEEPAKKIEQLISDFNFDEWVLNNEEKLFNLFIEYSTAMSLAPEIPTVSYKVSELINDKHGNLCATKTNARIESLKAAVLAKVGEDAYNTKRKEHITSFDSKGIRKLDIVSGKDYIFPLLKIRFRSTVKTGATDATLKLRLSISADITSLQAANDYVANI